jgi:enterochelin esterase-like enzyme
MLSPEYAPRAGSLRFLELESSVLRGNRFGDPLRRRHPVYLPPQYELEVDRDFPLVLALIGYAGTGFHFFAPGSFVEPLHLRLDRLIASGMPPLIVVGVDAFTRLGGSQYVNGACGRYEDLIVEELLPALRRELRTTLRQSGAGVVGKSSGGFGALHLGLRHPELFTAVAAHAPDAGFEHCNWISVADFVNVFDRFEGDESAQIEAFLQAFWNSPQPSLQEGHALMMLAYAAAYSPDPNAQHGFRLPFDPRTGARHEAIWERWLAMDPVRRVGANAAALRKLRLLHIDCGNRDQYAIHLGTRQLQLELQRCDVPHHYEEFDGTHSGLQFRYDVSIPKLVAALEGKR